MWGLVIKNLNGSLSRRGRDEGHAAEEGAALDRETHGHSGHLGRTWKELKTLRRLLQNHGQDCVVVACRSHGDR